MKTNILDLKEVSRYLHLNERTVYSLVKRKELPAAKFGKQWRVKKEHLDALFDDKLKEVEKNKSNTHLIKIIPGFLGIKTGVLNYIQEEIFKITKPGATIFDIFGGTNIVAYSLKRLYKIYTNDYQKFSYIIGKALIENPIKDRRLLNSDIVFESKSYINNKAVLNSYVDSLIEKELKIIKKKNFHAYKEFCLNTPYMSNNTSSVKSYKGLINLIRITKEHKKRKSLYSLFTTYYINSYFGVRQCVEIDSIRCAIDNISTKPISKDSLKPICLSALIYAIYASVSSVGSHFAQPQIPKGEGSVKKIMQKHNLDIRRLFENKLVEIRKNLYISKFDNKAFNHNFHDFFGDNDLLYNNIKDTDLMYIDTPYTIDHFSRFYHIPETLINYDYPLCKGKGRYRQDRLQSNFCIKSKVYNEFDKLISYGNKLKAKLVISYSDSYRSLLNPEKDITTLCNKYYKTVKGPKRITYSYSGLGQSAANEANEILIICNNPK